MAGHSHSANIAVRKGKQDNARAKVFSKLARYIMIAAKNGGGDPDTNLRLRYAIDKARHVSMPKENIERAVKKGTGDLEGASYEEITYEGYGPGGTALLVETLTDNRNRTATEIRTTFEKSGGNQGLPGSVSYLFVRKGLILIETAKFRNEDELMEVAMNANASDFLRGDEYYEITCEPTHFPGLKDALEAAGYFSAEAEVKNLPAALVDIDVETGRKLLRMIDKFEDNDDVQAVYTNANITAEMAD